MQLSVSTSPADPLLAALLPGGDSVSGAEPGLPLTPFGALFPGLAPTPASGPVPAAPSPLASSEVPPTWIGSTQPQLTAQPALTSASRPPVVVPGSVVSTNAATVVTVEVTPPVSPRGEKAISAPKPASTKPAAPALAGLSFRSIAPEQPAEPGPLSPEMALALAATVTPPPVAPIALALTETAPTPTGTSSETPLDRPAADSPAAFSPRSDAPVVTATASPTARPIPMALSTGPSLRFAGASDNSAAAAPVRIIGPGPKVAPFAADVTAPSLHAPSAPSTRAEAGIPSSDSAAIPLPSEATLTEISAYPGAPDTALRNFAPAEILSRHFAPAPSTAPAPDLASAFHAPHAIAFTYPVAPALAAPTPSSPAPVPALLPSPLHPDMPPAMSAPLTVSPTATPSFSVSAPAESAFTPGLATPASAPLPIFPLAPTPLHASPTPIASPASPTPAASAPAAAAIPLAVDPAAVAPRELTAAIRAEKNLSPRGAKIAASAENNSSGKNSPVVASDKTFVSVSSEHVARPAADVGTGVAKSEVAMPSALFNRSTSAAVLEHAPVDGASVVPQERFSEIVSSSSLSAEPVVAAQRAVEAVLTAVERFSAGERHSVNLSFAMGDTALDVRVELRDDAVHATFRTDSPELRQALAQQWQAATGAGESGERSLRLAAPVFTGPTAAPSTAANFSSFTGGDGSSRQRESAARRDSDDSLSIAGLRSRGSRTSSVGTVADTSAAPAATRSAPPTSHRLHTHA